MSDLEDYLPQHLEGGLPSRSTSRPLMLTPPAARRAIPGTTRPESPLASYKTSSSPKTVTFNLPPDVQQETGPRTVSQTNPVPQTNPVLSTTTGPATTMSQIQQVEPQVSAASLFDDFEVFLSKLNLKAVGSFLALIYGTSMFFMLTELSPTWLVVVISAASFVLFRVLGV